MTTESKVRGLLRLDHFSCYGLEISSFYISAVRLGELPTPEFRQERKWARLSSLPRKVFL